MSTSKAASSRWQHKPRSIVCNLWTKGQQKQKKRKKSSQTWELCWNECHKRESSNRGRRGVKIFIFLQWNWCIVIASLSQDWKLYQPLSTDFWCTWRVHFKAAVTLLRLTHQAPRYQACKAKNTFSLFDKARVLRKTHQCECYLEQQSSTTAYFWPRPDTFIYYFYWRAPRHYHPVFNRSI